MKIILPLASIRIIEMSELSHICQERPISFTNFIVGHKEHSWFIKPTESLPHPKNQYGEATTL
jgi:hypothetical protein